MRRKGQKNTLVSRGGKKKKLLEKRGDESIITSDSTMVQKNEELAVGNWVGALGYFVRGSWAEGRLGKKVGGSEETS